MYVDYLKVKGTKYKIYFKEVPDHILGLCDKENKKIIISNKCPPKLVLGTLSHEIGHALCHETYLDLSLEHGQEEIIAELFAYFIEQYGEYLQNLKEMQIEASKNES